jgi:hypothetical protein
MSAWEDTSLTTLIASWSLVFVSNSEIAGNCTRARRVCGWALVCVGSLRTASNYPRAGRIGGAAVARSFSLRQDTRCIARHAIGCTLTASRLLRAGVMLLFATQTSITEALRTRYPNTRQRARAKEISSRAALSPGPIWWEVVLECEESVPQFHLGTEETYPAVARQASCAVARRAPCAVARQTQSDVARQAYPAVSGRAMYMSARLSTIRQWNDQDTRPCAAACTNSTPRKAVKRTFITQ